MTAAEEAGWLGNREGGGCRAASRGRRRWAASTRKTDAAAYHQAGLAAPLATLAHPTALSIPLPTCFSRCACSCTAAVLNRPGLTPAASAAAAALLHRRTTGGEEPDEAAGRMQAWQRHTGGAWAAVCADPGAATKPPAPIKRAAKGSHPAVSTHAHSRSMAASWWLRTICRALTRAKPVPGSKLLAVCCVLGRERCVGEQWAGKRRRRLARAAQRRGAQCGSCTPPAWRGRRGCSIADILSHPEQLLPV